MLIQWSPHSPFPRSLGWTPSSWPRFRGLSPAPPGSFGRAAKARPCFRGFPLLPRGPSAGPQKLGLASAASPAPPGPFGRAAQARPPFRGLPLLPRGPSAGPQKLGLASAGFLCSPGVLRPGRRRHAEWNPPTSFAKCHADEPFDGIQDRRQTFIFYFFRRDAFGLSKNSSTFKNARRRTFLKGRRTFLSGRQTFLRGRQTILKV